MSSLHMTLRGQWMKTPHAVNAWVCLCVCRYSTVGAGGWFYMCVVQCLLISPWAICLIYSSSLFTQRDSQPTAFPLPLATLRMLADTLVYMWLPVWYTWKCASQMYGPTCVVQVFQKLRCQSNLALHRSLVERGLKTPSVTFRITFLRKQPEESIIKQ